MLMIILASLAHGFKVALCFHSLSIHLINSSLNWFEARDYCAQHKYVLASIYSMEEYNLVKSYPGGAWIGLSDIQDFWKEVSGRSSNSWRWSGNKTLTPGEYQNWMLHQPDNDNAMEYCVLMKDGQWMDGFCESSLPFICFTGWFEPGFKEFIYVSTNMTWAAAKSHCRLSYTDLAMIQDEAENTAVASIVPSTESVWIGLYRTPWNWVSGRRGSFINWAPGQPDNINGAEECVWVDKTYQWSDESCGFKGPFFCREDLKIRNRRIKIKLQSGADLSDPAIYNQIIQQVSAKLEHLRHSDFKLTWKTASPKT